jgi:hypothetical protein
MIRLTLRLLDGTRAKAVVVSILAWATFGPLWRFTRYAKNKRKEQKA